MSISYRQERLGDFANSQAAFDQQEFPSAVSSDVGLTSNAYGMYDPKTGQARPYTAQDLINQGGGDPNKMISVPYGADFLANYGAYIMLAPVVGMIAGAAAAGGAAAGAEGGGAAAGTAGAYDATAAGIDAGGMAGVGGAGGVASGMSGAVADGLTAESFGSTFGITGGSSSITGLADSTFGGASPTSGASPFLMSDGSTSLASMGGGTGLTAPAAGGGVVSSEGVSSAASDLGTSLSSGTVSNAALDSGTLSNIAGDSQSGGMLSSFLNWVKASPSNGMLAASFVQTIGGLLNGIGQAKSQRELLQYQQQLAEQLAQWQRQFIQSGSYWGGKVGISPSGKPLTRPSGAPVYGSGGLISNALAGS